MTRWAVVALLLAVVACNYPPTTPDEGDVNDLFTQVAADRTAPPATVEATPPQATVSPVPTVAYTPRFEAGPCPAAASAHADACGVLIVPQDRTDPDSMDVRLPVAIIRGRNTADNAPVVYLSGGPGSAAIDVMGYHMATAHNRFLNGYDYIFFDQRGTGGAEPSLACPERWDIAPRLLSEDLTAAEAVALSRGAYDACLMRLRRAGVDPAHYNSATSAADLADLIRALGYERANIYGVSYGTRLALAAMRDHPQVIESVILDSPYPPQVNLYDTWTPGADRALELVFEACLQQANCDDDLRTRFYTLVESLNTDPLIVPLQDLYTGNTVNVRLTGDLFIDITFTSLYRWDNIPRLPQTVEELERGVVSDYTRRFLGLFLSRSGSAGVTLSVQCNEELAFSSMAALREASAGVPEALNEAYFPAFEVLYASCPVWVPNAPNLPIANNPVTSDIPTLILTGEVDPITPPEWGPLTAETLPNATVVEFPAVGHWIVRSGPAGQCAMDITLAFLAAPQTPPDTSCIGGLPGLRFP